jgi:hypothetical protein
MIPAGSTSSNNMGSPRFRSLRAYGSRGDWRSTVVVFLWVRHGGTGSLGCELTQLIADAESVITALVRRRGLHRSRGEFDGGAREISVSAIGGGAADQSDLGE